jgi:hypothetical protein
MRIPCDVIPDEIKAEIQSGCLENHQTGQDAPSDSHELLSDN